MPCLRREEPPETALSAVLAIGLAAASALAWSALDAVRKSLTESLTPMALVAGMTCGQGLLFALWVAYEGQGFYSAGYLVPGGLCLALNVVANVLFVEAVRVSPLSLTVPLLSLSPVFASLFAIPILGEVPTPRQWAGIVAVVTGALWLNAGSARGLSDVGRAFVRERGSVLMALVAAMWALTVALDKQALSFCSEAAHALVQTAGVCAVTAGYLVLRRRGGELAQAAAQLPRLGAAVILGSLGLGLQLLAIGALYVGAVETIKRAVGLILAVVFGRLFFQEPVTKAKVASIVAMAAGTGLVIWH